MTTALSPRGKQGALLIAGILMIATTLRVTFTGAAPLLETIRSDYGLSTAQTGLLTTLPLLAFALVSPLAAGIARRFGMERSLFAAMLLICAGIALRSLPSAALLFAGTAIIGCGIALGNVLLPGLIKRDFSQHVARLTGAYSLTMGAAAALGSALVVPLALHGFGWRDDDPRPDVYRPARQFGASGGGAFRHGAVGRVFTGGMWAARHGKTS